jgi:hypothetical protein
MGSGSSTNHGPNTVKSNILTEAQAAVIIQTIVRMQKSKKRAAELKLQREIQRKQEAVKQTKLKEMKPLSKNHERAALKIQVFHSFIRSFIYLFFPPNSLLFVPSVSLLFFCLVYFANHKCAFRCFNSRHKLESLRLQHHQNIENAERAVAKLRIAILCQRLVRAKQCKKFADIVLKAIRMRKRTEADGDDFLIAVNNGDIKQCLRLLPYNENITYDNMFLEEEEEEGGGGIEFGNASINWVDRDGLTGLHIATLNGDVKMIEFLMNQEGCDINPVSRFGRTPLGLIKDLLVNVLDPKSWPHYKSEKAKQLKEKYEKCFELLLSKGAALCSEEANMELLQAAEVGDVEKCKKCIDDYGASPNVFGLTKRLLSTYHREIPRSDGLPSHEVLKHLYPKNRISQKVTNCFCFLFITTLYPRLFSFVLFEKCIPFFILKNELQSLLYKISDMFFVNLKKKIKLNLI